MTQLAEHPAPLSTIPSLPVDDRGESAPPQALHLISAVLEAMMGRRALHQLRPHLASPAFMRLVEYVEEGLFRRTMIGGVRTQMPTGNAVEASVRLALASRWITCVLRLDSDRTGWRCSDLVVLQPCPV